MSETIDGEEGDHRVLVRADPAEVVTEQLPDHLPDVADTFHIQVSDLNKFLQTEFTRVGLVSKLFFRHFAEVLNELDNSVLIKVKALLND